MKGIMFTEDMFNAVIDGSKTQTRRVIKPQLEKYNENDYGKPYLDSNNYISITEKYNAKYGELFQWVESIKGGKIKPRYKVGEIVYLKETFYQEGKWFFDCSIANKRQYVFEPNFHLDDNIKYQNNPPEKFYKNTIFNKMRMQGYYKRSKLFMPEKYARYFIKILDVKVEKVQSIKPMDVISEGIFRSTHPDMYRRIEEERNSFRSFWNSIHKTEYTWKDNPFVFAYKFELIKEQQ